MAQQWLLKLNEFVAQHQRFPSQSGLQEERALYAGVTGWMRRHPDDPISKQFRQLRQQYPPMARGKSTQQWLKELEDFLEREKHWPSQAEIAKVHEKTLYAAIARINNTLPPDDPALLRIKQLRAQYPSPYLRLTTEQRLEELETFLEQENRWPSVGANDPKENSLAKNLHSLIFRLRHKKNLSAAQEYLLQLYQRHKNTK